CLPVRLSHRSTAFGGRAARGCQGSAVERDTEGGLRDARFRRQNEAPEGGLRPRPPALEIESEPTRYRRSAAALGAVVEVDAAGVEGRLDLLRTALLAVEAGQTGVLRARELRVGAGHRVRRLAALGLALRKRRTAPRVRGAVADGIVERLEAAVEPVVVDLATAAERLLAVGAVAGRWVRGIRAAAVLTDIQVGLARRDAVLGLLRRIEACPERRREVRLRLQPGGPDGVLLVGFRVLDAKPHGRGERGGFVRPDQEARER